MNNEIEVFIKALSTEGLLDNPRHWIELLAGLETDAALHELQKKCRIDIADIFCIVARFCGLEFFAEARNANGYKYAGDFPEALARKRRIIPFIKDNGRTMAITCEVLDNKRERGQAILQERYGDVDLQLCTPAVFNEILKDVYGSKKAAAQLDLNSVSPQKAVDMLMAEAVSNGVTDIHIEPLPKCFRIRMRADGMLKTPVPALPRETSQAIIQRLKVASGLDITESRKPQDGSFVYKGDDVQGEIDIRCASAPTRYGERLTLRLLGINTASLNINNLGLSDSMHERVLINIKRPHGLFLIAGPTGSGKSTTLYAALGMLNSPELNLMTVEDPIEYSIPGISQMQVDGGIKLDFSTALRSILRHDPDVLMIGEIRDGETASIAIRASITGHMVFSSIHANTAPGSVTRLMDMGCESHLLASALNVCLSQRLVRRLCNRCKRKTYTMEERYSKYGLEECFMPAGCQSCSNEGFSGRTAIFEMLDINENTRESISAGEKPTKICAASPFYVNLLEDGMKKVSTGITSPCEVFRVAGDYL